MRTERGARVHLGAQGAGVQPEEAENSPHLRVLLSERLTCPFPRGTSTLTHILLEALPLGLSGPHVSPRHSQACGITVSFMRCLAFLTSLGHKEHVPPGTESGKMEFKELNL